MISVFKTNVSDRRHIKEVKPLLDGLLPDLRWNFDLKDCDNILRVDCPQNATFEIIEAIKSRGFECIELE